MKVFLNLGRIETLILKRVTVGGGVSNVVENCVTKFMNVWPGLKYFVLVKLIFKKIYFTSKDNI